MKKNNMTRFTEPISRISHHSASFYEERKKTVDDELSQFLDIKSSSDTLSIMNEAKAINMLQSSGLIIGAHIDYLDISGCKFDNVILLNCILNSFYAKKGNIKKLSVINSSIKYCDFSHSDIYGAVFFNSNCDNGIFRQVNLGHSWLQGHFRNTVFNHSKMQQSILIGDFQHASFQHCNMQQCWMRNSSFEGSTFLNANVHKMFIHIVNFGVGVILPDGTQYEIGRNTFKTLRNNIEKNVKDE